MKIKIILLTALLAFKVISQAQVSEGAFKKAVDYINFKTIEFSINSKPDILQQFQKSCSYKNGAANEEIIDFLSSLGDNDATIAVSNEIELIKNDFNRSWKVDDEVKFLTETIFTNKKKYQKLYLFAEKRKNDSRFTELKSKFKKDLPSILTSQEQLIYTSQPNSNMQEQIQTASIEERLETLEQKAEPKLEVKAWFDGFTFQIDIFSIILSVVIMFLVLKIFSVGSDNGSDVSESIKGYVKTKVNDAQFKSNGNSNSGASLFEVNKLKDEIEQLRAEVKQWGSKTESSKNPLEIVQQQGEQQSWKETNQPDVKSETFFLSIPNSDGTFNDSSVSQTYREGASIYKFTKVSNRIAKFQIDEKDSSIKLALNYPDKSIDPVCEALNAFNAKSKRIITVEAGEAELQGDKWIVNKKQKAKIRYES